MELTLHLHIEWSIQVLVHWKSTVISSLSFQTNIEYECLQWQPPIKEGVSFPRSAGEKTHALFQKPE